MREYEDIIKVALMKIKDNSPSIPTCDGETCDEKESFIPINAKSKYINNCKNGVTPKPKEPFEHGRIEEEKKVECKKSNTKCDLSNISCDNVLEIKVIFF